MSEERDSFRVSACPNGKRVEFSRKSGFDEIVVGRWLHLEQMDKNYWWMRLGDQEADIKVDTKGRATVSWRKP